MNESLHMQRTYDFIEVCGWFAARCDLILLLFDPAKLDISDEMKQVSLPQQLQHVKCLHMVMLACYSTQIPICWPLWQCMHSSFA